ncbi:MAG: M20/M25/M40 family metallo-hydrolase, partial [Thermoplasmata archaeon]|nr:M20/M25/M40 family metallo-hydrolase [Thermoplasmata archaeon]
PSRCTLRIDRHVVPGESKQSVMKEFRSLVGKMRLDSSVNMRWMKRPTPFLESYLTKRVQMVKSFISEHGRFYKSRIGYSQSVGDYNLFANRMPTVVFGPRGKYWHTRKEYVDVDSVKKCAQFYRHFLTELNEKAKKI